MEWQIKTKNKGGITAKIEIADSNKNGNKNET